MKDENWYEARERAEAKKMGIDIFRIPPDKLYSFVKSTGPDKSVTYTKAGKLLDDGEKDLVRGEWIRERQKALDIGDKAHEELENFKSFEDMISEAEVKMWYDRHSRKFADDVPGAMSPNLQHIKHRQIGYAPNPMFEPNTTTNCDPIWAKEMCDWYMETNPANNQVSSIGKPTLFGTGGEGFNGYRGFNDLCEQQPNPLEAFKAEYPMTPEEAWPSMIGNYQRKMLLLL